MFSVIVRTHFRSCVDCVGQICTGAPGHCFNLCLFVISEKEGHSIFERFTDSFTIMDLFFLLNYFIIFFHVFGWFASCMFLCRVHAWYPECYRLLIVARDCGSRTWVFCKNNKDSFNSWATSLNQFVLSIKYTNHIINIWVL